jgi:chromosome segregation ATPase
MSNWTDIRLNIAGNVEVIPMRTVTTIRTPEGPKRMPSEEKTIRNVAEAQAQRSETLTALAVAALTGTIPDLEKARRAQQDAYKADLENATVTRNRDLARVRELEKVYKTAAQQLAEVLAERNVAAVATTRLQKKVEWQQAELAEVRAELCLAKKTNGELDSALTAQRDTLLSAEARAIDSNTRAKDALVSRDKSRDECNNARHSCENAIARAVQFQDLLTKADEEIAWRQAELVRLRKEIAEAQQDGWINGVAHEKERASEARQPYCKAPCPKCATPHTPYQEGVEHGRQEGAQALVEAELAVARRLDVAYANGEARGYDSACTRIRIGISTLRSAHARGEKPPVRLGGDPDGR